ncbi:hypothetical protein FA95DRAFT_1577888 [Auriscalpium vulgare]|uniref:Uncharacterized protein n=1 Tax=Auriscalpium vulgare TaxID=40419 RepID=A0ACB8R5A1_9AGAM|nr:hypothetical protein FA95DRAFT_1577888 [Auriscalpium vulgare]
MSSALDFRIRMHSARIRAAACAMLASPSQVSASDWDNLLDEIFAGWDYFNNGPEQPQIPGPLHVAVKEVRAAGAETRRPDSINLRAIGDIEATREEAFDGDLGDNMWWQLIADRPVPRALPRMDPSLPTLTLSPTIAHVPIVAPETTDPNRRLIVHPTVAAISFADKSSAFANTAGSASPGDGTTDPLTTSRTQLTPPSRTAPAPSVTEEAPAAPDGRDGVKSTAGVKWTRFGKDKASPAGPASSMAPIDGSNDLSTSTRTQHASPSRTAQVLSTTGQDFAAQVGTDKAEMLVRGGSGTVGATQREHNDAPKALGFQDETQGQSKRRHSAKAFEDYPVRWAFIANERLLTDDLMSTAAKTSTGPPPPMPKPRGRLRALAGRTRQPSRDDMPIAKRTRNLTLRILSPSLPPDVPIDVDSVDSGSSVAPHAAAQSRMQSPATPLAPPLPIPSTHPRPWHTNLATYEAHMKEVQQARRRGGALGSPLHTVDPLLTAAGDNRNEADEVASIDPIETAAGGINSEAEKVDERIADLPGHGQLSAIAAAGDILFGTADDAILSGLDDVSLLYETFRRKSARNIASLKQSADFGLTKIVDEIKIMSTRHVDEIKALVTSQEASVDRLQAAHDAGVARLIDEIQKASSNFNTGAATIHGGLYAMSLDLRNFLGSIGSEHDINDNSADVPPTNPAKHASTSSNPIRAADLAATPDEAQSTTPGLGLGAASHRAPTKKKTTARPASHGGKQGGDLKSGI